MTKRKYSPPTIEEVAPPSVEPTLSDLDTDQLLTRFQELEAMRAMAKRIGDIDSARRHKEAQHAIRLIIQERTGRYL